MNILIVTQYFWPENFKINDLVTELVGRGHCVTVLTGKPNYPTGKVPPEFEQDPQAFSNFDGARIFRVPMFVRGQGLPRLLLNYASFALSSCFFAPWKLRHTPIDVIFVYQLSPVTVGLPAIIVKFFRKAPIAFWIQDLWPDTLDAIGVTKGGWPIRLANALTSFIYNRCDLILAQSRSFVSVVVGRTRNPGRVAYFPTWAEASPDVSSPPAAEVPDGSGKFTILFAGNVGVAQDFPAILDAAAALRERDDIRWLIVGDGRMSGWVEEEVRRRKLEKSVLLLGRFPLERMPSFYAHADALLVALQDRAIFGMTIPNKVQSGLQTGIPILSMIGGETAEIIRRAHAGMSVPPGDGLALARAIVEMAAMPEEERRRMGENGRRFADEEFNRDRLIDRLEDHLTVLAKPAAQQSVGPGTR